MTESRRPPQPMLPSGFAGRIFGFVMERLAEPNYRWVIAALSSQKPRTYLEIGFGTGRLAELVAQRLKPARIAGVDPSRLMFDRASRRLKRYRKKTEIDLRLGDDTALDWSPQSFDAIIASHSFQFWSDPLATFARLRALLAPGGRVVLVIRSHISDDVRAWIPNPITKADNELAGLRTALAQSGFRIERDEKLRTGSQGIVAVCA
jgi:ubiquinone/menaquinone biosynthesis C-methylase UbiE